MKKACFGFNFVLLCRVSEEKEVAVEVKVSLEAREILDNLDLLAQWDHLDKTYCFLHVSLDC